MIRSSSSDSYALFARMVLEAMGIGSALVVVGCGGDVTVDSSPSAAGAGGAGGHASSSSSSTSSSNSTAVSGTAVSSSSGQQPFVCNDPYVNDYGCGTPFGDTCPPAGSAEALEIMGLVFDSSGPCPERPEYCWCDTSVSAVPCGPDPTAPAGSCCYYVQVKSEELCEGRPFMVDGHARTAALASGPGWSATPRATRKRPLAGAAVVGSPRSGPVAPEVSALDSSSRERLAAAWSRDALYEHASVASFSRFALELMSVGAPSELVRGAQQAMGEEIRHAELCFALASAFAGRTMAPGPLRIEDALAPRELSDIAAAVVLEGCVGETIAALLAGAARDAATDAAVHAALDEIADDEAAHAALAWRTVAWACDRGGPEVWRAVEAAFAAATLPNISEDAAGVPDMVLRAYGRLPASAQREVAVRGLAEVVRPCARALLARLREGIDWDADTVDATA